MAAATRSDGTLSDIRASPTTQTDAADKPCRHLATTKIGNVRANAKSAVEVPKAARPQMNGIFLDRE